MNLEGVKNHELNSELMVWIINTPRQNYVVTKYGDWLFLHNL